jgi:hypothetical protein
MLARWWHRLSVITEKGPSAAIILCAAVLGVFGMIKGREGAVIGDATAGVPELRPDSRYNLDSNIITASSRSASTSSR